MKTRLVFDRLEGRSIADAILLRSSFAVPVEERFGVRVLHCFPEKRANEALVVASYRGGCEDKKRLITEHVVTSSRDRQAIIRTESQKTWSGIKEEQARECKVVNEKKSSEVCILPHLPHAATFVPQLSLSASTVC
jgi:hypothetical protein